MITLEHVVDLDKLNGVLKSLRRNKQDVHFSKGLDREYIFNAHKGLLKSERSSLPPIFGSQMIK